MDGEPTMASFRCIGLLCLCFVARSHRLCGQYGALFVLEVSFRRYAHLLFLLVAQGRFGQCQPMVCLGWRAGYYGSCRRYLHSGLGMVAACGAKG